MNKRNKMNQVQDEEIDLFKLFKTLWDSKRQISAFIVIAVLLSGSFIFFKTPLYKSELFYSIDTIPPFYQKEKVSIDFKKKFYSKSTFKGWRKSNYNTSLVFEDFSATEVINGFVLSKSVAGPLATLEKKNDSYILVNSDHLSILDDFFKYAEYINNLLKVEYINRAKDELNIIETKFKDFSGTNDTIISQILTIDRYIAAVKKGDVFTIQNPTLPKKISPRSRLILILSILLGGMIGVSYVLISNAICKRKDKLGKD